VKLTVAGFQPDKKLSYGYTYQYCSESASQVSRMKENGQLTLADQRPDSWLQLVVPILWQELQLVTSLYCWQLKLKYNITTSPIFYCIM
jgi:hypothetical protein